MYKRLNSGVRSIETQQNSNESIYSWDSARAFLALVRYGSFRRAASEIKTSVNTLRKLITNFENDVNLVLITRDVNGVHLTDEGRVVIETIKRMERASQDLAKVRNLGLAMKGEVRLSITEGLGVFWVAPQFVELQEAYPGLLINLNCAMHVADVMRLETDIAIQFQRPSVKELSVVRLATVHSMMFASSSYIAKHGCPTGLAELRKHRLILQVTDQLQTEAVYSKYFPDTPQVGFVSVKSNSSNSHYAMIANGAGIGSLPTYAAALTDDLIPVDLGGAWFSDDLWLTYHPDVARIPRVRRLIDWLVSAFSSRKYPWFSRSFIHPTELRQAIKAGKITLPFERLTK